MKPYETAAEVRTALKDAGVTGRFSVKRISNPFTGDTYFDVSLPKPEGIAVITESRSGQGTRFYSTDEGKTAQVLQQVQNIFRNTNVLIS